MSQRKMDHTRILTRELVTELSKTRKALLTRRGMRNSGAQSYASDP